MPLLLLLLISVAAGCAAGLAAWRYRVMTNATPGRPALAAGHEIQRHSPMRSSRLDPQAATGLLLTLALALVLLGGLALALLAVVVRSTHGLASIDAGAARWGNRHATGTSTQGLKLVTDLGETWMVVIVGAIVALVEITRTRSRWVLPFLLAVIAGDKFLTTAIKALVDRARPTLDPAAAALGPSFPSGHTATAAAFWAAVALVVGRWCGSRARTVQIGLAVGIAVAVALSRVLLDVHWLTDVIGGLVLGWAWFAACAIAFGGRLLRFGAAAESADSGQVPLDDRP